MAHIILTGATGNAGAAVFAYALNSPSIARISILSRRPVKLAENSPKANVIIVDNFEEYPKHVLGQLQGATGCIWALGIKSGGMTEADYTKITLDYPVAAAKALSTLGDKMNFVYMPGEGAQSSGESMLLFGRVKGRAENALLALPTDHPSLNIYNIRPATINPEGKYLAERKPTLHDKVSTCVGGVFEWVWKSFVIPTDKLAKVCVDLAVSDGISIEAGEGVEADGRLLRNTALRRLAGM